MTREEFEVAFALDAQTALEVFKTYPTRDLLALRTAHQLDQAVARSPEGIAFGGCRIALIDFELRTRGVPCETSQTSQKSPT